MGGDAHDLGRQELDAFPVAVLVFVDGALVRTNEAWTLLSGLSARESVGDQWLRAVHADDHSAAVAGCRCAGGQGTGQDTVGEDLRICNSHGHATWVHSRVRHADWAGRQTCVMTLTEISAHKANESRLRQLAMHDVMTGLLNKGAFMAEVERCLAGSSVDVLPAAVLFVDLDHFKVVNDSYGHALGDQLLVTVAQRIRLVARTSDRVARLGGDEFGLLCSGLGSPDEARRLAERIVDVVSKPFSLDHALVHLGVSVGIAYGGARATALSLLERADRAMYAAKAAGGSRWVEGEDWGPGQPLSRCDTRLTDQLADLAVLLRSVAHRTDALIAAGTASGQPELQTTLTGIRDTLVDLHRRLRTEHTSSADRSADAPVERTRHLAATLRRSSSLGPQTRPG